MKKAIIIALTVVLAGVFAASAIAFGPGYGMGKGHGLMASNLAPEQTQKFAQFQEDTLSLRQKMLQLKSELLSLRSQTSPDWSAIAAKQKEMVDVRTEIQKKAAEAGAAGFGQGFCECGRGGKGLGMGRIGM